MILQRLPIDTTRGSYEESLRETVVRVTEAGRLSAAVDLVAVRAIIQDRENIQRSASYVAWRNACLAMATYQLFIDIFLGEPVAFSTWGLLCLGGVLSGLCPQRKYQVLAVERQEEEIQQVYAQYAACQTLLSPTARHAASHSFIKRFMGVLRQREGKDVSQWPSSYLVPLGALIHLIRAEAEGNQQGVRQWLVTWLPSIKNEAFAERDAEVMEEAALHLVKNCSEHRSQAVFQEKMAKKARRK